MKSVFVVLFALLMTMDAAYAQPGLPLARIVDAYGGAAALNRIEQVETDWAGYFIARYQSRHTDPPYNRTPTRSWSALDLNAPRSVIEWINTYPGELNLGRRAVNDGRRGRTLNTISRIYAEGAMIPHQEIVDTARRRMPLMIVREMIAHPDAFEAAGTRAFRGVTYDLIRWGGLVVWVHPDTALIYGLSWRADSLVDVQSDIMRTYTNYFEHDGVMVNRRYQNWIDGEVTIDHELYAVRFNHPLDAYLRIPETFERVRTIDGYNGVTEIGVESIGNGVFLAGDGETRVLYVEFEDHFVAMEAGGFPEYAERAYNAMRPHTRGKPLRYIIPTHHHDDHAVAVHFYARIGATILTTRDKEGFLRRLLARPWGDAPPVTNARFRFIDEPSLVLEDRTNRLAIYVYQDAPHTENMLVGYLERNQTLYTCDVFIGWVGDVRQGASYSAHHLERWVASHQTSGAVGPVRTYASCHGRAYSAGEFSEMLATERTIVMLPSGETSPSASWFERYGLVDDTAGPTARRDRIAQHRDDAR